MKFDLFSSPGPDITHLLFIKNCLLNISDWLTKLINQSIRRDIFPDKWKLSFIIPLLKGWDPADINNYRPISKYCLFAKIINCLVYNKISSYLQGKFVIIQQHGYRDYLLVHIW